MNEQERNRITENGRWPLLKTRPDDLPPSSEDRGERLRIDTRSSSGGQRTSGSQTDGDRERKSAGASGSRNSGRSGSGEQRSRTSGGAQRRSASSTRRPDTGRRDEDRRRPRREDDSAGSYLRDLPDRFRRFLKNPTADIPFLVGCVIAVVLIILIIALIVRAAAGSGSSKADKAAEAVSATSATSVQTEPAPAYTPTDVKLSFVGDVLLGMDENMSYSNSLNAFYDLNGANYFFQNVKSVFAADDITVANLEGTFTNSTTRSDKDYAYKADPQYVNILKDASIDAVDLANDHSDDYGEASHTDTVSALESSGISHFGNDDVALVDVRGIQVGFYGIDQVDDSTGAVDAMTTAVQKLKNQNANIIVGYFYWGSDQDTYPTQDMVNLAHSAVDAGTDLVVGCGTRSLEGIEYYHDKTIAYGLGSFCYGGDTNPSDVNTIILQPTFTMDNQGAITKSTLNVVPCQMSSDVNYNDYQPQILTGSDAQAVLDELNERSTEISTNYADITTVYNSQTDGTTGVSGSVTAGTGTESVSSTSAAGGAASGTADGTTADYGTAGTDGTTSTYGTAGSDGTTAADGTTGTDGTAATTDGTAADTAGTDNTAGTYDATY